MNITKNSLVIILISLFVLLAVYFCYDQIGDHWEGIQVDFPSFYYGADIAFNGGSPYKKTTWKSVKSLHLPNQDLYPYINIPPSLILLYPLTLFEIQVAQSILLIINIIAVFLLIYLIFFKILRKNITDPIVPIGGIFILLYPPIGETLSHGQVNLIVISLICIF
jgi:hypothetical protein